MELVAELRGRGQARSVRVPVPPPCPAEQSDPQDWELSGQLRGLRRGLAELQERVVQLLTPLVQEQREAAGGGRTRGEWGRERGRGLRPPWGAAHPPPA